MKKLKTLFATALLSTATSTLVYANSSEQQFEQGLAAAEKGDYHTAFKLWKPLAEQGYAKAQVMLGVLYGLGQGVQQDRAKAKMWIGKACDNGVQEACDAYRDLNKGQ